MTLGRPIKVVVIAVAGGAVTVALALTIARVPFSSETLRRRVISTLSQRLDSDVELGGLTLRLYPELHAVGTALTVYHNGRRDVPPLISVKRFTVDATFPALWRKHVTRVNLEGLNIEIPPADDAEGAGDALGKTAPTRRMEPGDPVRQVIVDEVVADNARLVTLPRDRHARPKVWTMHELHVHSVGVGQRMPFWSLLTNAVPPGQIETTGAFGPWDVEEPAETPLGGRFTFDRADLSVFRGISGILSAHGSYRGSIDMIDVTGQTTTPNFTIAVGGHPVSLTASYHTIVDGTNGDTQLERVEGSFLNSSFVARGGVFDIESANGHLVTLDVTMEKARLEDVMRLTMNAPKPPMSGGLRLKTKFDLPPGPQNVVDKLRLNGQFFIDNGRFSNEEVQRKINELSRRANGKVKEEPIQGHRVSSNFAGRFTLGGGSLALQKVTFSVPGALVELSGQYGLKAQTIDFGGTLVMDAKISETTTGFKSLLLKAVDPLFRKDGRTVIPIKITGTRNDPSFGLDMRHLFKKGTGD